MQQGYHRVGHREGNYESIDLGAFGVSSSIGQEDKAQPRWKWLRSKHIIKADPEGCPSIERVANVEPEEYDALSEQALYLKLASVDVRETEQIVEFTSKYGLLGTAGWYWKVMSPTSHIKWRMPPADHEPGKTEEDVPPAPSADEFLRMYYPLSTHEPVGVAGARIPEAEPVAQFRGEVEYLLDILMLRWLSCADVGAEEADRWRQVWRWFILERTDRPDLDNHMSWFMRLMFRGGHSDYLVEASRMSERMLDAPEQYGIRAAQARLRKYFAFALSSLLSDVVWSLSPGLHWAHTYQPGPPSLLPAMYLQLAMDTESGKPFRICRHAHCGHFFMPTRSDRIYCSEACKNAATQKALRDRRRAKAEAEACQNEAVSSENRGKNGY